MDHVLKVLFQPGPGPIPQPHSDMHPCQPGISSALAPKPDPISSSVFSGLHSAPYLYCCCPFRAPIHHALPNGSMGILSLLLSVTVPPASPAFSPYWSLKSRIMEKEPMLSKTPAPQSELLPSSHHQSTINGFNRTQNISEMALSEQGTFSVSYGIQLLMV